MFVIGLTGGIASGKSTVSNILKENMSVPVIDADQIARIIVEPGKKAWKEIVAYFGMGILYDDQTINRKRLGEIIFNNAGYRKKINEITHPIIIDEIKTLLRYYSNKSEKFVVVDAALLIEINMMVMMDILWVVFVPLEIQIERLMKRNEFTQEEALIRIESQMPLIEKVKYADDIIDNSGLIEETRHQVEQLCEKYLSDFSDEDIRDTYLQWK